MAGTQYGTAGLAVLCLILAALHWLGFPCVIQGINLGNDRRKLQSHHAKMCELWDYQLTRKEAK
jgi:hypothetical protein